MAEFLNKEEIKQWRSSLEKITLEDFAARLGKVVADSRPTNDLVDIVMSGNDTSNEILNNKRSVHLSGIAKRAFEREKQLSNTPFSIKSPSVDANAVSESNDSNEIVDMIVKRQDKGLELPIVKQSSNSSVEDIDIVLKKNLTDREQLVLDYFLNHLNTTVYAKDLASLLDLPRDYIYKYIKNLRNKIEGDRLINADRGGFILTN